MDLRQALTRVYRSLPEPLARPVRVLHRWTTVRLPLALALRRARVPRSLGYGFQAAWLVQSRLLPRWERSDTEHPRDLRREAPARTLKIMIGTLHSGEPQFDLCQGGINAQLYPTDLVERVVVSGLPNKQAHDVLYRRFLDSRCDILVKIDADTVVLDENFLDAIARYFLHADDADLLQMAVRDHYTACPMQGVNAYTRGMLWHASSQDPLFTDRTATPRERRRVVPTRFVDSVIHSPDPSAEQAFRFGVHRALKLRTAAERPRGKDVALQQATYLERTYRHFQASSSQELAIACVGAERTLRGEFDIGDLDYPSSKILTVATELSQTSLQDVGAQLRQVRSTEQPSSIATIRGLAGEHLAANHIDSVLFILPHVQLYGGVLRFLALTDSLTKRGVEAVIAVPDNQLPIDRSGLAYRDVPIVGLSSVHRRTWDAAVCGDHSSGLLALLPWIRAHRTAAYLLTGWSTRTQNVKQIAIAAPDIVLANSSYAADQYPELLPHAVPGGVDLEVFSPDGHLGDERGPIRIGVPGGRRLPRKRFADALAATASILDTGTRVELHVWNATPISSRLPGHCKVHVGLDRSGVADLLRSMHVVICPEEDAGWNNPAAEAMACGVPLVCTPAGTTDFAFNEQTALVVEPRQPEAIADAVQRIVNDPEFATRLRRNGLEVIESFGWPGVAQQLLDVLGMVEPSLDGPQARQEAARRRLLDELRVR